MKAKNTLSKIIATIALTGFVLSSFGFAQAATPIKVIGFYSDSLARPLATTDTTMTLVRGTDYEGRALSGFYAFVIDQGNPAQEVVEGTVSGVSVTGLVRGIDSVSATTTDTTNIKQHARGASVNITTFPATTINTNELTGVDSIPTPIYYASTTATTTIAANRSNLATWGLVQDTAFSGAGAIAASTNAKGYVQIATPTQVASSTSTGSSGAIVVVPASVATSTWSATTPAGTIPTTGSVGGKIDSNFIATSSLGLLPLAPIGNGSDGAILFDGTHSYAFAATTSSTVYKLSRGIMATSITISAGITVDTNGYQIFANGTVSGSGKFRFDGNSASGLTPATSSGNYFQTTAGVAGGNNTPGSTGLASYLSIGPAGVSGSSGNFSGGPTGTTTIARPWAVLASDVLTGTTASTTGVFPVAAAGGSGGGGGGSSSSFTGGGSAASGGVVEIIANIITGTWTVEALGGVGGSGNGGGAGSGGGGSGGDCAIFYNTNTWTGGCTLTGGTGGNTGLTGTQYLSSISSLFR